MTMSGKLAALASVALMISATSASAKILVATWTGTVTSGYDQSGIFGTAGADLTGASYIAKFTYNTSVGNRNSNLPYFDIVEGGVNSGVASPASASIIINSFTKAVSGNYVGYVETYPAFLYPDGRVFTQVTNIAEEMTFTATGYIYNTLSNQAFGFRVPALQALVDTPVAFTDLTGFSTNGYASFYEIDDNTGVSSNTYANLSPATLQVSYVPEPGSWALLMAGFGLAGAALRRRRLSFAA